MPNHRTGLPLYKTGPSDGDTYALHVKCEQMRKEMTHTKTPIGGGTKFLIV